MDLPVSGDSGGDTGGDATAADATKVEGGVDTTGPTVVFSEPADGAIDVDPTVAITVMFSETVDPNSLDPSTFVVTVEGSPLEGVVSTSGSSASFLPTKPLALLTLHAVTINTGVCDLAGNPLQADHSFSFLTRDRRWGVAEKIDTGTLSTDEPDVAMDASGNAMAVWTQYGDPIFSIWATSYAVATDTWQVATLAESNDSGDASEPSVAVDPGGNAMVAYWQFDGVRFNIWANRYLASSQSWGTPQLIESNDSGDASAPRVAIDASGNAVVVFWQFDGARFNIWANRFVASNGTWGTAQLIENIETGDASAPQVAVNSVGDAVAAFWAHDGSRFGIWANRFSASSNTWADAEAIESNSGQDAGEPQVAIDPAGNAMVVWPQYDGTRNNIWANRFTASKGTWGNPQLVDSAPGDAANPQVAMDDAGNALVVWRQLDGDRFDLWAKRYRAASNSWSAPQLIESTDFGHVRPPSLAMDRYGNALVVWPQHDGVRYDLWANRYRIMSDAWGNAELIESTNFGNVKGVQLAMDPDGRATAVWAQFDGALFDIWANRFD